MFVVVSNWNLRAECGICVFDVVSRKEDEIKEDFLLRSFECEVEEEFVQCLLVGFRESFEPFHSHLWHLFGIILWDIEDEEEVERCGVRCTFVLDRDGELEGEEIDLECAVVANFWRSADHVLEIDRSEAIYFSVQLHVLIVRRIHRGRPVQLKPFTKLLLL